MRTGLRIALLAAFALALTATSAWADDELSVLVSNPSIALGETTTLAAHVVTSPGYGGGHVEFKYKDAGADCALVPSADDGIDVGGDPPATVAAGQQTTDVGGQILDFGVGTWRVCGWLLDDAAGTVTAYGSATVTVVAYVGKMALRVTRSARSYQVAISYDSSSLARLFATVRPAARKCPTTAARASHDPVQLLPKFGRTISGAGGVGRTIKPPMLANGRYRVCAWIQDSPRSGSAKVGPVTKTFSVTWPRGVRGSG